MPTQTTSAMRARNVRCVVTIAEMNSPQQLTTLTAADKTGCCKRSVFLTLNSNFQKFCALRVCSCVSMTMCWQSFPQSFSGYSKTSATKRALLHQQKPVRNS